MARIAAIVGCDKLGAWIPRPLLPLRRIEMMSLRRLSTFVGLCCCAGIFLSSASARAFAQASTPGGEGGQSSSTGLPGTQNPARSATQTPDSKRPPAKDSSGTSADAPPVGQAGTRVPLSGLGPYQGRTIASIEFRGVEAAKLDPLPQQLPQQPGQPLDATKMRESLRRLYASGLYETIAVEARPQGDQVILIFVGTPRLFVGPVLIQGVKNDRLANQLERSSKLDAGSIYSKAKIDAALTQIKSSLRDNGYYQPTVTAAERLDQAQGLMYITFAVRLGPPARVGEVSAAGDPGMTIAKFRKVSKLKRKTKVAQDTNQRALKSLRKRYQAQKRLEAKVTLDKDAYVQPTNTIDYGFNVDRGPIVKVDVDGAKVRAGKIRSLIPVFQEGAVDEDLLNEGTRNLRDYFQNQGFANVYISHDVTPPIAEPGAPPMAANEQQTISYHINRGLRHKVAAVTITGNKYFDDATIRERLAVTKADVLLRFGHYTQTLENNDVKSITALYQSNGFNDVKVTATNENEEKDSGAKLSLSPLSVVRVHYSIEEGQQRKIGALNLVGIDKVPVYDIQALLNTQVGQPYSLINLSGDREAVLGYYLSHGFADIRFEITQTPDPSDPLKVDISMRATEGEQTFIRNIYIAGLHFTRPDVVDHELRIHSGDPLDQSALLETQRRLYDLSLFNEVDTAIIDPNGDLPKKDVLLDIDEARRWNVNYSLGFEVQTGNPSTNCPSVATLIQLGIDPSTYHCSPDGKTGGSIRVGLDLTRINFRGRDQSLTLHTAYGSLEQAVTGIFANPHWFGRPNLTFSVSGGYTNSQDVTTFAASRLEANVQLQQKVNRANTFIYRFTFRRIKVDPNSIQVSADEIPLLSQPVRVGGPGVTYIRDTRDSPLNAHRGTYTTSQFFLSNSAFASQANFARIDVTQSSYYAYGKRRWVFARSTRYGAEAVYGNLSYTTIPLPERLFAGGSTSHRGFAINDAGPRDPQTGYPIGGAGAFVNSSELRTPPATLPYVGNNLSFVLFHDMGNVFNTPSNIWGSMFRVRQPDSSTCKDLSVTGGQCDFNDFSHALGLGARYATPVGPIRVDFSYNLNPPIYPVLVDPINGKHVGQASHFNFFFSLGQSF